MLISGSLWAQGERSRSSERNSSENRKKSEVTTRSERRSESGTQYKHEPGRNAREIESREQSGERRTIHTPERRKDINSPAPERNRENTRTRNNDGDREVSTRTPTRTGENRDSRVTPTNNRSSSDKSYSTGPNRSTPDYRGKEYREHHTPDRYRVQRERSGIHRHHTYSPVEYRRVHYPYRRPVHIRVVWNRPMYREYVRIYPEYRYWHRYHYGHRIRAISAYDAYYHVGDIMNVYGKVSEVYRDRGADVYVLYFGAPYPYHDFTVIVPEHVARRYGWRPEWYFHNRHVWVTGLISFHEDKPEMVIQRRSQLNVY